MGCAADCTGGVDLDIRYLGTLGAESVGSGHWVAARQLPREGFHTSHWPTQIGALKSPMGRVHLFRTRFSLVGLLFGLLHLLFLFCALRILHSGVFYGLCCTASFRNTQLVYLRSIAGACG